MKDAKTERAYGSLALDAICVVVLIAYFLHFALPALRGGFREDEMMNMGICWCAGALKSLWQTSCSGSYFFVPGCALYDLPLYLYRPGGALYYLPLYHFFDLNPLPYRIVQISILVASIPLVYYLPASDLYVLSRLFWLSLSLLPPAACRPRVRRWHLFISVLCGFFYFAALAYYVPYPRERGLPTGRAMPGVSGPLCYGAKLQGNGSYPSRDRPNL